MIFTFFQKKFPRRTKPQKFCITKFLTAPERQGKRIIRLL
jgi:hypothetical protein